MPSSSSMEPRWNMEFHRPQRAGLSTHSHPIQFPPPLVTNGSKTNHGHLFSLMRAFPKLYPPLETVLCRPRLEHFSLVAVAFLFPDGLSVFFFFLVVRGTSESLNNRSILTIFSFFTLPFIFDVPSLGNVIALLRQVSLSLSFWLLQFLCFGPHLLGIARLRPFD